jgi:hypothetical protein
MTSLSELSLGARITSGMCLRHDGSRLVAHHFIARSIKKLP